MSEACAFIETVNYVVVCVCICDTESNAHLIVFNALWRLLNERWTRKAKVVGGSMR